MTGIGICILRILFRMLYLSQIIRFIHRTDDATDKEYHKEIVVGSFIFTMLVLYIVVRCDLSDLVDIKNVETHILDIDYFVR